MAYEVKPNSGSLFVNEKKTSESHPDFQGKIIISAELIRKLAGQGEAITFEVSGWKKTTGSGKNLLSLAIKEPYKKPESSEDYSSSDRYNPDYTPTRPAPTKAPPTSADAQRYLDKLKVSIAKIENYPDFEELYNKINSPKVWEVFKTVTAIAQEASSLLSAKKSELILATAPVDLSAIISKIDVEIARLKLPAKQHCLARWNKSRSMLTPQELQIYLDELAIAQPVPPSDDFF
jgi:hypothetical protein